MGQHAGHFVLLVSCQNQPGVHRHIATQGGKGVDLAFAQQKEGERLLRFITGSGQPLPDIVQPTVQQRVIQHITFVAELGQHHRAVFGLFGGRQHAASRGADIRQAAILCGGTGGDGKRTSKGDGQ